MSSETSDIYTALGNDHRQVERLFDQLEVSPERADYDDVARKRLAQRLVMVGSRHEAAEEMVFWPGVRRMVPDGNDLADAALAQEREAKYILDTLRLAASADAIAELAGEFARASRAHIAFEEEQVWPELRRHTTRLAAAILGLKFAMARRLAPTRPHPQGPDRRLGLFTAGVAAATMDRVRDAVSGRRT